MIGTISAWHNLEVLLADASLGLLENQLKDRAVFLKGMKFKNANAFKKEGDFVDI